jgi:hypothetical protein
MRGRYGPLVMSLFMNQNNLTNIQFNSILVSLSPKEVIAFFNRKFIVSFLESKGFTFKENQLEYHRNTPDFKQVIWHRCSRNNMTGHIIDFEIGSYILSSRFKTWYKKTYTKDPIGGNVVCGAKSLFLDKWNAKYGRGGIFGYDLINKDIADQFTVMLENLKNVVVPNFDFYQTFDSIIDNPQEKTISGEYDLFPILRQIEHCLFKGDKEKARRISETLFNNPNFPEVYHNYRDTELARIFHV